MSNKVFIAKVRSFFEHAFYVMLIAFPQQQWLHKRASMLRLYVQYTACLVRM